MSIVMQMNNWYLVYGKLEILYLTYLCHIFSHRYNLWILCYYFCIVMPFTELLGRLIIKHFYT